MSIRIVNNKRVDMTPDESAMYDKIVKSYTTLTNKGEDLFIDLFETDEHGIIVYLKPPSKRQTSMEVFLFLISLMQHQHLRIVQSQVNDICTQMKAKIAEIDEKLKDK
jgi:hypothetical protein